METRNHQEEQEPKTDYAVIGIAVLGHCFWVLGLLYIFVIYPQLQRLENNNKVVEEAMDVSLAAALMEELAKAKEAAKLVQDKEPFKQLHKTCHLLLRPNNAPDEIGLPLYVNETQPDGSNTFFDPLQVAQRLTKDNVAQVRLPSVLRQKEAKGIRAILLIASKVAVDVASEHFNKSIEGTWKGTAETISTVANMQ